MNRSRLRRAATASLAGAALLTSGCGSSGAKTTTTRGSHSGSSTTQASVGSYINSVTRLEKPIENAASDFFHSPHTPAVQLRLATALHTAYANGARQLSNMTPPSVAIAAQRNLVNAWSSVAAQLANVTNRRPFSYSRAYSVAAAAEQPTAGAYSTILTLP